MVVGRGAGVNVLGRLNEDRITQKKVKEVVREMRKGKAPGLYGCAAVPYTPPSPQTITGPGIGGKYCTEVKSTG